jgi:hypothetical protein
MKRNGFLNTFFFCDVIPYAVFTKKMNFRISHYNTSQDVIFNVISEDMCLCNLKAYNDKIIPLTA